MDTRTVTLLEPKPMLIFPKHQNALEVSSHYKYSIVEFIVIECMLHKIREMRKIFIFLRIALAKGY